MKSEKPNIEYRISKEYKNSNYQHARKFLSFKFLSFEFVSEFEFRNSSLIAFFVFLFVYLLIPLPLNAQEFRTITIIPPTVSTSLNPGQTTEGVMKVVNDSSEPLLFKISTQDFVVTDTLGTPSLLPPDYLSKKFSAASWIAIYPNEFSVPPHSKQELNYYLQIPADARPGGHYAAAVYTPTNNIAVAGTGTSVQTQVGTLFYVTVNGPIKEQSFVTRFFASPFQEYGPVKLTTEIKNLGDLHVKPQGVITVTDLLGRVIQKEKLADHNVFPTAIREYVNMVGEDFMIGPFKASFTATYGKNNDLPLVASAYFWVFPWKITLLVILIAIAAILGWKYWKKQSLKTQKDTEKNTD